MHCTCIIEFVCAISSFYNKQHGCELSPICCMLGYLTLLKTINSELFPKITNRFRGFDILERKKIESWFCLHQFCFKCTLSFYRKETTFGAI